MSNEKVNVLTYWDNAPLAMGGGPLKALRFEPTQTAIRLMTSDTVPVKIHFCKERELNSYVRCNGQGCVLCQAGKKMDERLPLPVYVFNTVSVEIMTISPNCQPGALWPQIKPLLETMVRTKESVIALVSKPDLRTFQVTQLQAAPHHNLGEIEIKEFMRRWEAGEIDPASVYPKMDNAILATIPGIATMLGVKGVTLSASN